MSAAGSRHIRNSLPWRPRPHVSHSVSPETLTSANTSENENSRDGDAEEVDTKRKNDLLQSVRKLLSDFEELHNLRQTPLDDTRVLSIRGEVVKLLPSLYRLTDTLPDTPSNSEVFNVKYLTEAVLRKFPDAASIEQLRPLRSPGMSVPVHENEISSALYPPVSNVRGLSHNDSDWQFAPAHVQDAVKRTPHHQKRLLLAVHQLLGKRSLARFSRQSWYEAPIGLSPDELQVKPLARPAADLRYPHSTLYVPRFQTYVQRHPPVTGMSYPPVRTNNGTFARPRTHRRNLSKD